MNTLRALLDSGVPLVAVSFGDDDSERAAKEALASGVDIAELRIDRYSRTDPAHVREQVGSFHGLPLLATIRSAREGGGWTGSEQDRLALFRSLAPLVDGVDIELSSQEILADVIAAAREHGAVAIVSYHNFDHTPDRDELAAITRAAKAAGADIVKISTMATKAADLKTLAALLVNPVDDTEMIVIAMGGIGTASRIFFPALGSRLTYTFIGHQPTSGQLDFAETSSLLRKFYPEYNERKTRGES